MNEIRIYGIKNCNSMTKAFKMLEDNNRKYTFIDFKKHKIEADFIEFLLSKCDIDILINKKGTTYKKIKDEFLNALGTNKDLKKIESNKTLVELIVKNLSLIKRPVVIKNNHIFIGLDSLKEAITTNDI